LGSADSARPKASSMLLNNSPARVGCARASSPSATACP
jgi:hypothetical protein